MYCVEVINDVYILILQKPWKPYTKSMIQKVAEALGKLPPWRPRIFQQPYSLELQQRSPVIETVWELSIASKIPYVSQRVGEGSSGTCVMCLVCLNSLQDPHRG